MNSSINCKGFDISPQAISIASKKEKSNLTFYNEDFLESTDASSDLLLLLDVFEHIPDYRGYLNFTTEKDEPNYFPYTTRYCS